MPSSYPSKRNSLYRGRCGNRLHCCQFRKLFCYTYTFKVCGLINWTVFYTLNGHERNNVDFKISVVRYSFTVFFFTGWSFLVCTKFFYCGLACKMWRMTHINCKSPIWKSRLTLNCFEYLSNDRVYTLHYTN